MKAEVQSALDAVEFDPRQPANISYAKARYAIDEVAKSRAERREAKLAVVTLLKGEVIHHQSGANRGVVKKDIKFPDGTVARF